MGEISTHNNTQSTNNVYVHIYIQRVVASGVRV